MTTTTTTASITRCETALDWFQRSQKRRTAAQTPTDPSSAARVFVSGNSGLAPIDMAWKLPTTIATSSNNDDVDGIPLLVVEGKIAKTWMLLSLAARFVVSTRPSRFAVDDNDASPSPSSSLPQVVILDSSLDMSAPNKLVQVVRSTLLRQVSDTNRLEEELEECLARIHVAMVEDEVLGWLPVLEALRFKLKKQKEESQPLQQPQGNNSKSSHHPTLILWDGYNEHHNQASEITRQITRLWDECSVAMVFSTNTASSSSSSISHINTPKWNWLVQNNRRRTVHHIHLEQRSGKDCFAIVNDSNGRTHAPRSFSISAGGILS